MSVEILRENLPNSSSDRVIFLPTAVDVTAVGRAVCALLNTSGGVVYCGIRESGEPVDIEGDITQAAETIELRLQHAIAPTALVGVGVGFLDAHEVIVIEVPEGKDQPYVFEGGVWLSGRTGPVPADRDQLRHLLRVQASIPLRWERLSSPSIFFEEIDRTEVEQTVREAESASRFKFSSPQNDNAVLGELGMLQDGLVTHAGDVLFFSGVASRHPQCRVQFVRISGDKTSARYEDNRWFEGPLVRVCKAVLEAVQANNGISSEFSAWSPNRSDHRRYDADSLREGIVNAFVHRDYSAFSGGLRLSMFDDRIEIWNSGRLPEGMTVSELSLEHPSIPVNPDIAHVFYLRSLMERIGRGTQKIIRASQLAGARPPLWTDEPNGVTLTIFAASSASTARSVRLNDRQQRLIADLKPGHSITPKEYVSRYGEGVTPRHARRDLEELEAAGWLRRDGRTRATSYRLA
jgi:ATP-dependent DNA helicase RecG